MDEYFINRPNLDRLARSLSKIYQVYVPFKVDGSRHYTMVGDDGLDEAVLGEIRAVETIKSFYFPARTKLAEYFSEDISNKKQRAIAIMGAKSCDLASLKILDYVFKATPFKDSFYISKREDGLIISSDCTNYGESCFCMGLGIMPYPTDNFDINLSEIESGYVAEIGSEKGKRLVKEYFKLFQNADLYIDRKEINRKKLKEELQPHVKRKNLPEKTDIQVLFKKKFDSNMWEEITKTCVECGACNVICPACHCFVLKDSETEGVFERLRIWDSCLLMSFAKVAGGANPRKLLRDRLRNRFDKKFNFFPEMIGKFGCTGCGRCSDACPGKIHVDEVLSKLQLG